MGTDIKNVRYMCIHLFLFYSSITLKVTIDVIEFLLIIQIAEDSGNFGKLSVALQPLYVQFMFA
jgi:hypothetical protein